MEVREEDRLDEPPPNYDPSSRMLTLAFYYGGKFELGPRGLSTYVGGYCYKFDYVEVELFMVEAFIKLGEREGIKEPMTIYSEIDDGQSGSSKQSESRKGYEKDVTERLDDIEEANESDSDEVNGEKGGNVENESDEGSDFNDSDYNLESESGDDSKLFKENTDYDVEWMGEPQGDDLNDGDMGSDHGEEDVCRMNMYDPSFQISMLFSNTKELREAIHLHAVKTKRSINITKNGKERLYAKYADKRCNWKLHALKLPKDESYQIRKYDSKHACGPNFHVKNVKSNWLSAKYKQKFRIDPKRNVKGFRIDVMEDIKCQWSRFQAWRAKKMAIE
ncbi:hypothetical protein DH2020_032272 [Rehmannia glutinosa]|uniref:Transposase MuDR plant domain-containing protein n=1 Tax=Rehmannia glutinosa TaxID=99300 RepID=A0ABR0VI55_REHGL